MEQKTMKALFIGRFQPFHKGHLMALQSIAKEYKEIIIGIGSSQYSHTPENPFTAEERKKMIERSLQEAGIKNFKIIYIPDIHNYPKWVSHVLSITSDFDIVISNNDLTKKLFAEKGFTIRETKVFDRKKYSGREIRKRMIKDKPWMDLVPRPVVDIIKKCNGVQRLKKTIR